MSEVYFGGGDGDGGNFLNIPGGYLSLNFVLSHMEEGKENYSKIFEAKDFSVVVDDKKFRFCCADGETKLILIDKQTQQSWYIYYVDRQLTSLNMLLNDICETDIMDHILVISFNGHYTSDKLEKIVTILNHNLYVYDRRFSHKIIENYTDGAIIKLNALCLFNRKF